MFALVIVRARTPLPRQTRQSPRCYALQPTLKSMFIINYKEEKWKLKK